ncbi:IS701 family transposase [Sorangium sp. So ce1078]|uniref:IS701 family transposase n=1 Tax=Sorangium sp. So ce1078 TaxID=3133329 RepID=UPI003F6184BA
MIVPSFLALLQVFELHFTAPSFRTFATLACGWVLALSRHMVTSAVRAANAMGCKHIRSFHRFCSKSSWAHDALGLTLLRTLDALVERDQPLLVALDDTLGRHTGKKIAAASMHRDPLLSTATRVAFRWGHVWVVLGICVQLFHKTWCLPVLFRLYRREKLCTQQQRAHRRATELAAELIALLAKQLPHRRVLVAGDGAYSNCSVLRGCPSNITFIGRSRLDAALYAPAPPRRSGQMGRPRVRGKKLPSPAAQANAAKARWPSVEVNAYNRVVIVKVMTIDALWYSVAHSELVRLIVVRGFPGHTKDDVLVSTDVTIPPKDIIELYAKRWSIETTFQETKGKLGFEQPRSRTERAVERTAPFTLLLYTLVVLWYARSGSTLRSAQSTKAPWYSPESSPCKTLPAFSDMLATLRRASWAERLFEPDANAPTLKKPLAPLLACLDTAASPRAAVLKSRLVPPARSLTGRAWCAYSAHPRQGGARKNRLFRCLRAEAQRGAASSRDRRAGHMACPWVG